MESWNPQIFIPANGNVEVIVAYAFALQAAPRCIRCAHNGRVSLVSPIWSFLTAMCSDWAFPDCDVIAVPFKADLRGLICLKRAGWKAAVRTRIHPQPDGVLALLTGYIRNGDGGTSHFATQSDCLSYPEPENVSAFSVFPITRQRSVFLFCVCGAGSCCLFNGGGYGDGVGVLYQPGSLHFLSLGRFANR